MLTGYQAFLIFAVFVASGISFLPGKFLQIFVRITVAVVGIISFLFVSGGILWGIYFAAGFGARSFGQDGPRMLGAALVALYFAVCSLTCLPIIPNDYLRSLGLGLHFIYLPIAVYLTTLGAIDIPFSLRLGVYADRLSLGLIYAMLWFRMLEMQRPNRLNPETPN
ncbi:MAG: hypothetical protein LV481_08765 [Methylacidiphilales bacterium]|nr:hypothetical protein [Candidatus Methylacidiphilales bacterium]